MNKSDVIAFFDGIAAGWDAAQIDKTDIINRILDHTGVAEGQDVLDVACGTGILFPFYMQRNVASVTGIDISHEMARLAAEKHAGCEQVRVVCGDVEQTEFDKKFDVVMVYNAFPHFPDPEALIARLCSLLKPGGRLTIAHGASREQIDDHHKGAASKVSNGLMHAENLKQLFIPFFDVEVVISNDRMYQVTGVKKENSAHYHGHSHGGGVHYHSHSFDHGHTHDQADTPMEELVALVKYMVGHNTAHAEELAQLAQKLDDAGNHSAYRRIMDAVVNYDVGNATLAAVLKDLTQEEPLN